MPRAVRFVGTLVLTGVLWFPDASAAQTRVRPATVEVGGGLALAGPIEFGAEGATLASNQLGTPERFTFFKTDTRTDAAPGAGAWVAANLTQVVGLEFGFQRSRPKIQTKISDDAEGVPALTLTTDSISQRIIEGNVVFHVNRGRFDGQRTVPFLLAGIGQLRQVDDEEGLVETGRIYQVGFGFKWVAGLTQSGRARGPGMRLDLRYVMREGGFDFQEDRRRSFVTLGLTGLMAF